jgi:hypothetical protein
MTSVSNDWSGGSRGVKEGIALWDYIQKLIHLLVVFGVEE